MCPKLNLAFSLELSFAPFKSAFISTILETTLFAESLSLGGTACRKTKHV